MPCSWTKEQRQVYMQQRYNAQRTKFIIRLGGVCVKCGATEGLEFDHIDPDLKSFDVGRLFGKKRLPAVYAELAKCQLLCGDCHQAKTNAFHSERMKALYPEGYRHGTVYSFMRMKCTCATCEAFKRQWNDARNNRRRGVGATTRGTYKHRKFRPIDIPDGHSWCNTHGKFLPIANFTIHTKGRNGLEYDCIECRSRARSPHLWCATSDLN